jgi:threonine/homoserine efflux transporter RhtA
LSPVFSPEVFVLGVAVGVLGPVLPFSLISAWSDTHRSRSILLFGGGQVRRPQAPAASQF